VLQDLDKLRHDFAEVEQRLRRVKSRHVNRAEDREAVRQFVRRFFEAHRPRFSATLGSDVLQALDGAMQDLLRCAQRRTSVDRYKMLLRYLETAIQELERVAVASIGPKSVGISDRRERALVKTLHEINPSAGVCYAQGIRDLQDAERNSWRGTILEFREALREALDTLAPDEEVRSSPGFQLEPGRKRPTMRQKVRFVLEARGLSRSQTEPAEKTVDAVEDKVGQLVRAVYDRASGGVHTTVGIEEAKQVKEWVTLALAELLEVRW
jgi:hypothetical protein